MFVGTQNSISVYDLLTLQLVWSQSGAFKCTNVGIFCDLLQSYCGIVLLKSSVSHSCKFSYNTLTNFFAHFTHINRAGDKYTAFSVAADESQLPSNGDAWIAVSLTTSTGVNGGAKSGAADTDSEESVDGSELHKVRCVCLFCLFSVLVFEYVRATRACHFVC